MEEAVENFKAFTGANDELARRYLGLTENNPEQAIQLYFDSPELASGLDQVPAPSAPALPTATRSRSQLQSNINPTDSICIHSDDETMDIDEDHEAARAAQTAVSLRRAADFEDDEAIARRLQEELYTGGDASTSADPEGVRAPLQRITETLVGGPDGDWQQDDMQTSYLQQMRAGRVPSARLGVFNQTPVPSIWDEGTDASIRRQGLAQATGGASEASSKAARLAELFRPPFELMRQIPWDTARDQGKEEGKWILINVQDQSIFDCQQLNRDIWKNEGVKAAVKEHFIFVQYSKDDPRGSQYIQYYFQAKDSDAAYPHIAIVDPRTGEQVKVWSGPPVPEASDFLMQIYEFLDRYSLDVTKKNPVAKRKPENQISIDVNRLTEDEMLNLALQNSLASGAASGPMEEDPDALTKSYGDLSRGKGKEIEKNSTEAQPKNSGSSSSPLASPFSGISADRPHIEPPMGPGTTRIQFKHAGGRIVRVFRVDDPVRRIYEWLKANPVEGKSGVEFELKGMGKDLINYLDETIEGAALKNGTVMVEFVESED